MLLYYFILLIALAVATFFMVRLRGNLTIWAVTVIVALLSPIPVYAISMGIAKDQKQTYHEYWNGYETAAYTDVTVCERDGQCHNEYDCDPYTETYWVTVNDADGEGTHQEMRSRTVYHDCPYSTEETSYIVDSTLDTYTIASHLMTGGEWRAGSGIPGGRITEPPALWSAAKSRIDAGTPGGVTKVSDYKNFILSSDNTVLKAYSDRIDALVADGLLPNPASGVVNIYQANKASFAGDVLSIDQSALNEDLGYLNGAVGSDLRGDVRMVFVDGDAVGSTEDYGNALMAYWQSEQFGRDAIAKNSIVIIVGVEGYKYVKPVVQPTVEAPTPTPAPTETPSPEPTEAPVEVDAPDFPNGTPVVSWVKAYTGMPLGNEGLLNQLENDLTGLAIDDDFIGNPTMDIPSRTTIHADGAVEGILFGENKFVRVSMESKDADDEGSGFKYLSDAWEPSAENWIWYFVFSALVFILLSVVGFFIALSNASFRDIPDPVRTLTESIFPNLAKY